MATYMAQMQFFPTQVGPPTEYAKSRQYLFIAIGMYQLAMCAMAVIEFKNYFSGIVMALALIVACMAWMENMNITYVCWYGTFCLLGSIVGTVSAFIGLSAKISMIVVKFLVPFSCFCGVSIAWWLYSNYEKEMPCNDMFGHWCRAIGLLGPIPVAKVDAASALNNTLLSSSYLPNFGGADAAKIQAQDKAMAAAAGAGALGAGAIGAAGAYGATAQAKTEQGYAGMSGMFGTAQAQGADVAATAQGKAEQGFAGMSGMFGAAQAAVPQGAADVNADPFMTQS